MNKGISADDLSVAIKEYRHKHKMTHTALAEKLGVFRSTIYRWEMKRVRLSWAMYRLLKAEGIITT